jgi:prevent-host-death family protein
MKTVGAYEAKTHLARLLEEVAAGEQIMITKHGVPIARLVPIADEEAARQRRSAAAVEALKEFRKGKRLDGLTIKDLINEGRKY